MPSPNSYAFTVKYPGIVYELKSDCKINQAFSLSDEAGVPPLRTFDCVWDTGASCSCISRRVVSECGLGPTGMTEIITANGSAETETYLINVLLPNNVLVQEVRVAACNLVGTDVLIGMDIISLGDFVVTNKDETVLSFRWPSVECLDFEVPHAPRP